jgi:hypothetical protein
VKAEQGEASDVWPRGERSVVVGREFPEFAQSVLGIKNKMPVILEKSQRWTEQSKCDQTSDEQGQRRVVGLQEGFELGHRVELYSCAMRGQVRVG